MRPVSVLPVPSDASDPFAGLVSLSNQDVQDQVTTWAGRMAAGEAQLLLYVGELDSRNAWSGHGVLSCVHWLSWRCGMGAKVASDRVRIARALRTLPKLLRRYWVSGPPIIESSSPREFQSREGPLASPIVIVDGSWPIDPNNVDVELRTLHS
jgi:hypothetical protein